LIFSHKKTLIWPTHVSYKNKISDKEYEIKCEARKNMADTYDLQEHLKKYMGYI
jgi:hypothetical protein